MIESMLGKHNIHPNYTYHWNYGSIAAVCLAVQVVSGILLAMHYNPSIEFAFLSIEQINRYVPYGWLFRYIHSNGASIFFFIVYLHMARSIWYYSYGEPRILVWSIGVTIYIVMMATGFMGYVLPWGQMSFWGATVITNLFSVIPFWGPDLLYWIWGGFGVSAPTIKKFFDLHYIAGILLCALVFIHMMTLHVKESNNPITICNNTTSGKTEMYPTGLLKDMVTFILMFIVLFIFVMYASNTLGHPDNYIEANALLTPAHIVPEWYFLPFYAILRSFPDKDLGVLCMGLSIAIFYALPFLHVGPVRNVHTSTPFRYEFFLFILIWLGLLWIGSEQAVEPYITIGRILSGAYFAWFLILLPINQIIWLQ